MIDVLSLKFDVVGIYLNPSTSNIKLLTSNLKKCKKSLDKILWIWYYNQVF